MRPFRFGVVTSSAPDATAWRDRARRVEALGYSSLYVPDHISDHWGPLVAMTVAAEATSQLKIGSLVLDNDYRHPVVLAKEIATLDLVSAGRVEFGIGAGWLKSDYDQSGIAYDPPGVRVDRLEEAIGIFKALFADGKATASGRHYTVTGAEGTPLPVTRPYPPLLIGGGSRRILRLAGREANIVGVNPARTEGFLNLGAAQSSSVEAYAQKVAWVREGAGPRWDSIELQCLALFVQVTTDRDAAYANLAPTLGLTPEDVAQVPLALIGTVDQICEQLQQRREELGISYWIVHEGAIEAFALVVERLSGS